jgi:hypothetical protein
LINKQEDSEEEDENKKEGTTKVEEKELKNNTIGSKMTLKNIDV